MARRINLSVIGPAGPTGPTGPAGPAGPAGSMAGPGVSVDNEVALYSGVSGSLLKRASDSGIPKLTSGVLGIAAAGTDYYNPGGTDVAVADGGTGASDATTARSNLGLIIGTNVQAADADLTALAGLAGVQGDIIYRDGSQWQRLPKGTAGQILRQNTALTAPEWAINGPDIEFMLTSNGSAIGPGINNVFGANSAFATEASTTYEYKAWVHFAKSSTGTVVFTLTSSVNITDGIIGLTVIQGGVQNTSNLAGVGTTIVSPSTGSLTAALNYFFIIRAVIVTNGAGNIRLNATESAGTITPYAYSRYEVRKLPSGNIGTFVA